MLYLAPNYFPEEEFITTLRTVIYRRIFLFVFSFFLNFPFCQQGTDWLHQVTPAVMYLGLLSWWHATDWRSCVAASLTKATKLQGTSPVSTVTQCCYKQLQVWCHISMACHHLRLRVLGLETSGTRIARSELERCSEHFLRTGKCCQWLEMHKARQCVCPITLHPNLGLLVWVSLPYCWLYNCIWD